MEVNKEPITVEAKKIEDLGLDAIQAMVLACICNPQPLIDALPKDKNPVLTRSSIAAFLGVSYKEVAECFIDEAFVGLVEQTAFANLMANRAKVDGALVSCATNQSPMYAQDRKLFYSLIGAIGDKGSPLGKGKIGGKEKEMSRSKRLERIATFMVKQGKGKNDSSAKPGVGEVNSGTNSGQARPPQGPAKQAQVQPADTDTL